MKKALLVPLIVVLVAGGALTWFVTRTPASPFDGAAAAPPSRELIVRGEYVGKRPLEAVGWVSCGVASNRV